jgi:bifunctional polynucleotide phosphatase/kinase
MHRALKRLAKVPPLPLSARTSPLNCPHGTVHPFFQKRSEKGDDSDVDKPFRWLPPLGPTGSCLHAVNQAPASTTKVAALDLDGTLIKADLRYTIDWQWWSPVVPKKLRELHEQGSVCTLPFPLELLALKPAPGTL